MSRNLEIFDDAAKSTRASRSSWPQVSQKNARPSNTNTTTASTTGTQTSNPLPPITANLDSYEVKPPKMSARKSLMSIERVSRYSLPTRALTNCRADLQTQLKKRGLDKLLQEAKADESGFDDSVVPVRTSGTTNEK